MALSPSLIVEPNDIRASAVAVVDTTGTQLGGFDPSRPATATLTQVAASAATQVLLAANAARRQFRVHNTANKTIFLAYAATATLTAYSVAVPSGQDYESVLNGYTGVISVIGSAGISAGSLIVTEITT